jgi:hypothetical protein
MSSPCPTLRDPAARLTLVCALGFAAGGCGGCDEPSARTDAGADARSPVTKVDAQADAAPITASFDDLPDAGPADLDGRAKHLLEAIMQNDAALAADIVLPRDAWVAARDAQDPGSLYESKFKTGFANHIARIHRHEKGVEHAVFVSFDLGQNPSRVTPKKHEWKEALWHKTRSTLTFTIDGRVHRIDVAEMIAWRGNWYVAHLRDSR